MLLFPPNPPVGLLNIAYQFVCMHACLGSSPPLACVAFINTINTIQKHVNSLSTRQYYPLTTSLCVVSRAGPWHTSIAISLALLQLHISYRHVWWDPSQIVFGIQSLLSLVHSPSLNKLALTRLRRLVPVPGRGSDMGPHPWSQGEARRSPLLACKHNLHVCMGGCRVAGAG